MKSKIIAFAQGYKKQIKGLIGLISAFVLLKGVAYLAPLFLSQIASPLEYGEFEYALNLGVMMVGVFSFGLPSAYAFFVMKNKRDELIPLFHFHFVLLAFLLLLTVLFFPFLISNTVFGAFIIGIAIADQVLVANMLKASGRNILSVVVDTGIYIVLGIIVILGLTEFVSFSKELWFLSILLTHLVFVALVHARGMKNVRAIKKEIVWELYRFGILILIAAPLLTLVTNSTRIYIEHFIDINEVGYYSFYFRIAAILLVIYRVLYIVLFRKLFLENHAKLDKYFAIILSVLVIASLVLVFVLNTSVSNFIVPIDSPYRPYFGLLPLMFFQLVFWIGTAFFEAIIIREKQLKSFIVLLVIVLGGMFIIMQSVAFYNGITLNMIIVINTWAIFVLFLGQQYLLAKHKIVYKKTILVQLAFGMFYALYLTVG